MFISVAGKDANHTGEIYTKAFSIDRVEYVQIYPHKIVYGPVIRYMTDMHVILSVSKDGYKHIENVNTKSEVLIKKINDENIMYVEFTTAKLGDIPASMYEWITRYKTHTDTMNYYLFLKFGENCKMFHIFNILESITLILSKII